MNRKCRDSIKLAKLYIKFLSYSVIIVVLSFDKVFDISLIKVFDTIVLVFQFLI